MCCVGGLQVSTAELYEADGIMTEFDTGENKFSLEEFKSDFWELDSSIEHRDLAGLFDYVSINQKNEHVPHNIEQFESSLDKTLEIFGVIFPNFQNN